MKKLKISSVYRLLILLLIGIYFNNLYIYIIELIYLLLSDYKELLIYSVLIILILLSNSIKTDYLKYGIVERKINNYYVINKILYKDKIKTNDLNVGDLIVTFDSNYIDDETYLKNNIKFELLNYKKIYNFKLQKYINNIINSFNDDVKNPINKFIYNINNYDDMSFNLGYGLAIYYILKLISKKSNLASLILIILYSFVFYFDIKFYLLIIDNIFYKQDKNIRYFIKIILILIINKYLLNNYSILVTLLFNLYNCLNLKIKFNTYFAFMQSILFGYINILNLLVYKYILIIQIFLFVFSLILLFIPQLSNIYLLLIKIYSNFNNIKFEIRGSLTIIGLMIYLILINVFNIKNNLLKLILISSILFLPINNPFFHITFIDVGQGDSILIKSELNKANILIDTGSKFNYYKLKKYLYSQGIYRIDYLIITHDDSDHNGNLELLNNDFKVKHIIYSNTSIEYGNINLINLYTNEYNNKNDSSLVYYLNKNNLSFLFTGDISSACERKIIKEYSNLKVDVLKASHHGSNTGNSEYFISNLLPRICCISTNGMYGHPHKQTLKTLDMYKVDTYTTKNEGNITFFLTKIGNIMKTNKHGFVIIK